MSMTRPNTKAQATLSVALTIMTSVARAATSQQDTQTNDILAMTFCALSWMMLLGFTGHLVRRCLNYNPADHNSANRLFKPLAQSNSLATQAALPAKQL